MKWEEVKDMCLFMLQFVTVAVLLVFIIVSVVMLI
jgi:hypothetical protein